MDINNLLNLSAPIRVGWPCRWRRGLRQEAFVCTRDRHCPYDDPGGIAGEDRGQ